jgi:hypothetical protein
MPGMMGVGPEGVQVWAGISGGDALGVVLDDMCRHRLAGAWFLVQPRSGLVMIWVRSRRLQSPNHPVGRHKVRRE